MKRTFVTILLALLLSIDYVTAQSAWRVYSPPSRNFAVDLPSTPKVRRAKAATEASSLFENTKFVESYTIRVKSETPDAAVLLNVSHLSKPTDRSNFDKEVHLLALIIGGDKEDSDITKQSNLSVNGYHGREYFFERNEGFYRLRFINAGTSVFFLMYYANAESELLSEPVSRIFETLRPKR
jgi:hypothetical protein